jgi:hypothetical protein
MTRSLNIWHLMLLIVIRCYALPFVPLAPFFRLLHPRAPFARAPDAPVLGPGDRCLPPNPTTAILLPPRRHSSSSSLSVFLLLRRHQVDVMLLMLLTTTAH